MNRNLVRNKLIILLVGTLTSGMSASATLDKSMTVTSIGAQTESTYFRVVQTLSGQCMFNVVYVDTKTVVGRVQLSVLLAAKSMGKNLAVLEYTKDAQGMCWANTIEIE